MAMNKSAALFLLQSAGRNLENARKNLDRTMEEAKSEMVLAYRHGVSVSDIARFTGVTRQTVYTVLDEAAKKENDTDGHQ